MSTQLAGALVLLVAVVLIGLGVLAWWRRRRRDSVLVAPVAELPDGSAELLTADVLYVATTRHDQPLERLAIRGMGLRSAADATVTDAGVALDLTGRPRVVIGRDALVAADQSTVVIDKVVERGGLARIVWRIAPDEIVDTYLRVRNGSTRRLVEAIGGTIPAPADPPVDAPTSEGEAA